MKRKLFSIFCSKHFVVRLRKLTTIIHVVWLGPLCLKELYCNCFLINILCHVELIKINHFARHDRSKVIVLCLTKPTDI